MNRLPPEPEPIAQARAEELMGDRDLGRDLPVDAMRHYGEAFRMCPGDAAIACKFHRCLVSLNELAPGETALAEACRRFPRDRRLRFLLIDILLRREKSESAMLEIESAMAEYGVDDGILNAALSVRAKLGPHAGTNTPSVSLCMIVKDEAEHLARCLRTAKPIVDEIIVIDTGSRDRSADIARAFGARVYDHSWRNDFSEARNVSLSKASGDWILVLDGDEAVSPRDYPGFRQIVAHGPVSAFSIRTRNYTSELNTVGWQPNTGECGEQEAGVGWFPSEKVRLFPRAPGIVFSHAVHELVEPSLRNARIPIHGCSLQVHHYGKLKEDLSRRKAHSYSEIEQRKMRDPADRAASLREAAILAARLGRHAESIDLWARFLEDHPDSPEAFVNMSAACLSLRRYEEAERWAGAALKCAPGMREAHINSAMAALHRGDTDRALATLEPLLRREPDYLHARFLLAATYACRGDHRQCGAALQPIAGTGIGSVLSVSFSELARSLSAAGQGEVCRRLVQTASQNGYADAASPGQNA